MTTTSETQLSSVSVASRRWRFGRVLIAFVIGFLLVAVAAGGSIFAYEQNYAGKVAAGVSIGGIDVSGLTRQDAATKLQAEFASVGTGTVTLDTPIGSKSLTYAQLGRRPDIDGMLDEAFAVGRTGNPVERVVEEARTAINRSTIAPRVAIDTDVLEAAIAGLATSIDRTSTSAIVTAAPTGLVDTPAVWGRTVDVAAMTSSISAALAAPDAPATMSIPLAVVSWIQTRSTITPVAPLVPIPFPDPVMARL